MPVNPIVVKIESEMFTPALQQAMKQAQEAGYSISDSLMAATNAHLNMLVEVAGADKCNAPRDLAPTDAWFGTSRRGFLNARQSHPSKPLCGKKFVCAT
jgi:hypothetical protein